MKSAIAMVCSSKGCHDVGLSAESDEGGELDTVREKKGKKGYLGREKGTWVHPKSNTTVT